MAHGRAARARGITLIELLVVLAVFGILAATAAPSFKRLKDKQIVLHTTHLYFHGLQLARQESIRRYQDVVICPLDAHGICRNDWNMPIAIFSDSNGDRQWQAEINEEILKWIDPSPHVRIAPSLASGGIPRRFFYFNAQGLAGNAWGNLTFCHTSEDPTLAHHLVIQWGGRVRQTRDNDGDGVVERADGKPVSCL